MTRSFVIKLRFALPVGLFVDRVDREAESNIACYTAAQKACQKQWWRSVRSLGESTGPGEDLSPSVKARVRLPIIRKSNLGPILHPFGDIPAFLCS